MSEDELGAWVAAAIADHVAATGVTLGDFALRSGVDVATVRRWRDGAQPADRSIGGLAYALGRDLGTELLELADWSERAIASKRFIDDPPDPIIDDLLAQVRRLPADEQRRLLKELLAMIDT